MIIVDFTCRIVVLVIVSHNADAGRWITVLTRRTVNRYINAAISRITRVAGAGAVVIAGNRDGNAPYRRIARVIRAGVVVIADNRRVNAPDSRIARVIGADIIVSARHRGVNAASGRRIAGIRGAAVIIIASGGGITAGLYGPCPQIKVSIHTYERAVHDGRPADAVSIKVI